MFTDQEADKIKKYLETMFGMDAFEISRGTQEIFELGNGDLFIDITELKQVYYGLTEETRAKHTYLWDFSHLGPEHYVNIDVHHATSTRLELDMPCFGTMFSNGLQIIDGWHRMYRKRLRGETKIMVFEFPAQVVVECCIGKKPIVEPIPEDILKGLRR